MNHSDLIQVIQQGGWVSVLVAGVLLAMSVASWSIMLIKFVKMRYLRVKNAKFKAVLIGNAGDSKPAFNFGCSKTVEQANWQEIIDAATTNTLPDCPYVDLALHGYARTNVHSARWDEAVSSPRENNELIASTLRQILNNQGVKLENGLTILASIGSLAPFVGLFGTVWGIYHALGTIAHEGQATIDKVAGPVGEALIMTAFGLGVAMPAVLAYNAFVRDNRLLMADLENFAHELYVSLTTSKKVVATNKTAYKTNSIKPAVAETLL